MERSSPTVSTVKHLVQSLLTALADPSAPDVRCTTAARARTCTSPTRSWALEVPAVREAARIADLGSGAGCPGLVLAIARPDAEVVLVESVGKKCAWLERTVERAGARERARRVRAGGGAGGGAVRRGDRAGAGRACRCCASTPRRCCARAARWWRGRARSTRRRTRTALHAAAALGLERGARCGRWSRITGLAAPHLARLSQGRRPRRRAIRADREWPQNAR